MPKKPYLTATEAAALTGVDAATFARQAPAHGIVGIPFMGAILYRRADIEEAIDQAWRQFTSADPVGTSIGKTTRAAINKASVKLPKPQRRHHSQRSNAA